MAAMDQAKLSNMCSSINGELSSFESEVKNQVQNTLQAFNDTWVSVNSQKLATEIKECLDELTKAVHDVFDSKNTGISNAVKNFNSVEGEEISYSGFSFTAPQIELSINATLPNGKKGVMDGASLDDIKTPINNLINNVSGYLDAIESAVKSADALDQEEQSTLSTSITQIKNKFNSSMTELSNSLSTRMSGEIAERDKLLQANKTNLS